jgi:methionyl-tRNA synthetase
MRIIMKLADDANRFVEASSHWKQLKQLGVKTVAAAIFGESGKEPDGWDEDAYMSDAANWKVIHVWEGCSVALNLFRQLAIYLAPVLPKLASQTGALLNDPITRWDQAKRPLVGTSVEKFAHMLKRVEEKDLHAMIEESKKEAAAANVAATTPAAAPTPASAEASAASAASVAPDPWNDPGDALAAEPLAAECTIDDFAKVDLRVARIVSADEVPEARKLLKLQLSLGGGVTRQVFAGIKAHYKPEDLVGRLVVCVANLAPRTMKFGVSEGMVVAAGGGNDAFLLTPDEGAQPGMRLH